MQIKGRCGKMYATKLTDTREEKTMRKKQVITVLMVAGMLSMLNGCSGAPKEKQIRQDFEANYFLDDGEKISDFSVDKRKTDKDEDTVWCTLTTQDDEASYERKYILTYYKYDKGGWTLEDIEEDETSSWVVTPIQGVSEETAKASLDYESVLVDGEEWEISSEDIDSVTIKDQKTDLEAGTDSLTLEVTLNGLVEKATGTIAAEYTFSNEGWVLATLEGKGDFTVEVKPECAFKFDEDSVIAALTEEPLTLGDSNEGTDQEITVNKDEIKNFNVESQTASSQGEEQQVACSFEVEKNYVTFSVNCKLDYYYDSDAGWEVQNKDTKMQAEKFDILGEWTGRYDGYDGGAVKLNITNVDGKTITAEYTYTPDTIDEWSQEGSYKVSGTIDETTLKLDLGTGDWITEPQHTLANEKHAVNGILYVEEGMISGTGQCGKSFTVKRDE